MNSYLPKDLINSLSNLEHFDPIAFQSVHESGEQLVSVHINPGKALMKDGNWQTTLVDPPFDISAKVPWAPDAWYLSVRPSFTLDPLFHAGTYYVQEASGMFLAFALQQSTDLSKKINVLDLCAAPGGKSTMIQSLISDDSLLVSNEVIKARAPVLCQNMTKWGMSNSVVSNNDPAHFKQLGGFFDIMVIDAPCSGSGLYRKDREAAASWSLDLVRLCSQRQQRILADAWDCLKENGILIYSTCSYSKDENEDILDSIFQQYACDSIRLTPDPSWNIVETKSDQAAAYGYRFYPDKLSGEGFFLAVIQKKDSTSSLHHSKFTGKTDRHAARIPKSVTGQLKSWISDDSLNYLAIGDSIHALPAPMTNDFEILKNNLYLKKAGIRMGKAGENEWIPDHELALAGILLDNERSLHVAKPEALQFLRGESFDTAVGERGWRLVSYEGHGLGWVKLLDKRMNNYYPKSWRIRH